MEGAAKPKGLAKIWREIKRSLKKILHRRTTQHMDEKNAEKPQLHRTPNGEHKHLCCEILHSHLNFEDDCLRPNCCGPSYNDAPKWSYSGEELSTKKLAEYLNGISKMIVSERCGKCPFAYYDSSPQKSSLRDFKLKHVLINHHRWWCNSKCTYCGFIDKHSRPAVVNKPYPVQPAISCLLASDFLDRKCYFTWAGGESTILPEFDTVVRMIHEKGYAQCMNTNGIVFSEAWDYVLANDLRTFFNISVDAGTAETYRKIKGVDYFDQVWENIKKYIASHQWKSHLQLHVKYIVMEGNQEKVELERFINKCLEANAHFIEYSVDSRAIENGIPEETIKAVAYLRALAKKNNFVCKNAVTPFNVSVAQMLDNYPLPKIS